MIISVATGKKPVRKCNTHTCLKKKTLRRVEIEGNFLLIKDISEKSTANITLNGEKLNSFPLNSRKEQGCPF